MDIQILSRGKLKTPGTRSLADHYLRLAQPYLRIQEMELKPYPAQRISRKSDRIQIQLAEAEELHQKIQSFRPPPSEIILLDPTGREMTTEEWSQLFSSFQDRSLKKILFCIGGASGFPESHKIHSYAKKVSLGVQTLSHELARVVLFEQIYRAISFLSGHPYHQPRT